MAARHGHGAQVRHQGPRYTSYPTAPQFSEDFDLQRYRNWQAENRRTDPLSIYVHLPFCHDICYYCACNKVVTRKEGVAAPSTSPSQPRTACRASSSARRPVTQMHWGGGTPTYLDDGEITELMHAWPAISACSTRATASTP
jgi:oxygen-independent coproporphyrinogen-3 oxidase